MAHAVHAAFIDIYVSMRWPQINMPDDLGDAVAVMLFITCQVRRSLGSTVVNAPKSSAQYEAAFDAASAAATECVLRCFQVPQDFSSEVCS